MRSTPDAVKFIQAIGALKLRGVEREQACEAERERLRSNRATRLSRLKERSIAS